eukprot:gene27589-27859_t
MHLLVDYVAAKKLIAAALAGPTDVLYAASGQLITSSLDALVEAARAAGDIRPDIQAADLKRLMGGFFGGHGEAGWADSARRLVDVLMDGLAMTHVLPDAAPTNWVDRHAPDGLRPWLKLGRFDRPAGIWLLMLPGWMGIALAGAMQLRWPDPVLLLQFLVGAALMRAAGCAFNDIVDRDFDAQVARTAMRPIPAGQISIRQAWAFLIGCSLISLLVLLTMNLWAVGLGVASLALVAAYPFMKRITWWPQAWLGLTFNW